MRKRILALFMALCLCAALLPGLALAEPNEETRWEYDDPVKVATAEELLSALPSGEGEPDVNNIVWIPVAKMTADITLDAAHELHSLGKLIIPDGCTLTLTDGAVVDAEFAVERGGAIVAEPGTTLGTTQAGETAIFNEGTITVARGATIVTQFGGHVNNRGTITLDGMFILRGFTDGLGNVSLWLLNSGVIQGGGRIVLYEIFLPPDAAVEYPDVLLEANEQLCAVPGIDRSVALFVRARDVFELQALAAAPGVQGIHVLTVDDPADMVITGGRTDAELCLTNDLDLTGKELCIEYPDLSVGSGATLTLDSLDALSFQRRFVGRLIVEDGGGTVNIGGTNIFGGASAILTPTQGYVFIGMAEWADSAPTTRDGEWYYLLGDSAVDASGAMTDDLALPLLVDGTLNIPGSFTHPGSVEIRNVIRYADAGNVHIAHLDYGPESEESALRGEESTAYELQFDLNTGAGYDDIRDHLVVDGARIYLDDPFNDVPQPPERAGYVFGGWRAESRWSAATAEKLALFTVTQDNDGRWFVPAPAEFPVTMVALWDTASGGSSAGATPSQETTAVVNEDGSVAVTVPAADAADGSAALPVELEASANAEDAPVISIDLPEGEAEVTVEIPLKEVGPATVAVLVHDDGTEEILPDTARSETGLSVTLDGDAKLKIVENAVDFKDVADGTWQGEAAQFVAARGLFLGVGDDSFAPEETMNRAMIATVLFRLARKPETAAAAPFDDVEAGLWYSEPIAWANGAGIVQGYGARFGTTDPVTREQLVVMLWRLSGSPAAEAVDTGASDWAADAMSWAVSVGLILGDGTGYHAQQTAKRSETAALLMRFIEL